jgi:hypothetical protein
MPIPIPKGEYFTIQVRQAVLIKDLLNIDITYLSSHNLRNIRHFFLKYLSMYYKLNFTYILSKILVTKL